REEGRGAAASLQRLLRTCSGHHAEGQGAVHEITPIAPGSSWHEPCVVRQKGCSAPEETMRWLGTLTEPLYGIIDLFLDSPLAAVVMTSAVGLVVAAMVLTLR